MKHALPKLVTLSSTVATRSEAQPSKAESGIALSELDKLMDVRDVHPLNADETKLSDIRPYGYAPEILEYACADLRHRMTIHFVADSDVRIAAHVLGAVEAALVVDGVVESVFLPPSCRVA